MSNYLYRSATVDDITAMAKIRAANSFTTDYWVERITGYNDGTVNPQKAGRSRIIIVVVHNEEIIGFTAGHLTKRLACDGELEWIDILPAYRRLGLASGLVNELFAWFTRQLVYKICVDPGNEEARQFYRKNGATDLNDHWMYWEDSRRRG